MMLSLTTSSGKIEQKTSTMLVSTENNSGYYVDIRAVGIGILFGSSLAIISAFSSLISALQASTAIDSEELRSSIAGFFTDPLIICLLSLVLFRLAIHLMIRGRVHSYLKYLSALIFFLSALNLVLLTNTEISRQILSFILSEIPSNLFHFLIQTSNFMFLSFMVYIGISFCQAPFLHFRERVLIIDKNKHILTEKIIKNPFPLMLYRNGKITFASPWVKEKYEYPLTDIVAVHTYNETSDTSGYWAMLHFAKTDTYLPAIMSEDRKENKQVIDVLCKFLAVPEGEDLNNKTISFSMSHIINDVIGCFDIPKNEVARRKSEEQSRKILGTESQKIAVSAAMMLQENQRRLTVNPDDPEVNLMLGIAFMGMNLFDAATEKLQKSKMLYDQLGQEQQSLVVIDYLEKLQAYLTVNSKPKT